MLISLLIPLLVSIPLAGTADPVAPAREAILPPSFELTVRGALHTVLDWRNVRFRVVPGKPFSVRRRFTNGESVELRGLLRQAKDGEHVLDITIRGVKANGVRQDDSFSENIRVGKEKLLCLGWVRWYEAKLVRAE